MVRAYGTSHSQSTYFQATADMYTCVCVCAYLYARRINRSALIEKYRTRSKLGKETKRGAKK